MTGKTDISKGELYRKTMLDVDDVKLCAIVIICGKENNLLAQHANVRIEVMNWFPSLPPMPILGLIEEYKVL